ncbi:MAG: Eco29kI family restriction endonuclease [Bacillota bacterium]
MRSESPYNPLDKKNLGVSVAEALLNRPVEPLPPESQFIGAGVYAIYYVGDYPAYESIAEQNRDDQFACPIYVGKAVPPGARKGGFGLGDNPGKVLCDRLREHAKSIEQAKNLKPEDFFCRYLVVDDIWIPLGESLLIEMFSPIWNKVIDGFGNHDPGKGRYEQQRSYWDVLHPGRPWAEKLQDNEKTEQEILDILEAFLSKTDEVDAED